MQQLSLLLVQLVAGAVQLGQLAIASLAQMLSQVVAQQYGSMAQM